MTMQSTISEAFSSFHLTAIQERLHNNSVSTYIKILATFLQTQQSHN